MVLYVYNNYYINIKYILECRYLVVDEVFYWCAGFDGGKFGLWWYGLNRGREILDVRKAMHWIRCFGLVVSDDPDRYNKICTNGTHLCAGLDVQSSRGPLISRLPALALLVRCSYQTRRSLKGTRGSQLSPGIYGRGEENELPWTFLVNIWNFILVITI